MKIILTISEILTFSREQVKLNSMCSFIGSVKASLVTREEVIKKVMSLSKEFYEQTDAVKLDLVDEEIILEINSEFIAELLEVYGNVAFGMFNILISSQAQTKTLLDKWTKK